MWGLSASHGCIFFSSNACSESLEQDLAMLKAIPHVDLTVGGMASLTLTSGTWQSLKVHGRQGLCITSSDANAFWQFLFDSSCNREISQPARANVCINNGSMQQAVQALLSVRVHPAVRIHTGVPVHNEGEQLQGYDALEAALTS